MDRIRVALIGCGGITAAHARGFLALAEEAQVVATVDVDLAKAEQRRTELGADAAYTDYRQALERRDVDAVDLCLPHDLHAEVAIAAAQAGKHVLCEKPIACNQDEARRMIAAAEQANVRLMIAYCERYSNQYVAMKRLLDEGAIGTPFLLRIDHNQWVSMPEGHWVNDPAKLGGGTVAGSGTHRLDLLRWFGGDVLRVAARTRNTGLTPLRGEDVAVIALEFANGALGEMVCSWSVRRPMWYEGFLVYGRDGLMHNIGGVQISRNGGDYEKVEMPYDDAGGFREEIRHFLACIRDGRTPLTDGREGLKALQLVEAVYKAAQQEAWIQVE